MQQSRYGEKKRTITRSDKLASVWRNFSFFSLYACCFSAETLFASGVQWRTLCPAKCGIEGTKNETGTQRVLQAEHKKSPILRSG
jgi:hypothetical protein